MKTFALITLLSLELCLSGCGQSVAPPFNPAAVDLPSDENASGLSGGGEPSIALVHPTLAPLITIDYQREVTQKSTPMILSPGS